MCTVLYSEWQYFITHGTHLILCTSLDRRGVWGRMDTCICTAESFCCAPETITTLLVGYTPIQNKNFEKNKRFKKNSVENAKGARAKML